VLEKACVIFNPAARNAPTLRRVIEAASDMKAAGWEVDVLRTEAAEQAEALAREAANKGVRVVFACGGDGTINEVANGLAGSETALAIMPAGMGNVFGKEAHVPRDLRKALQVLVDGEEWRFDLGRANDRYFVLMAGIGFDGAVVKSVPSGAKRRLGSTAYALWGAAETLRHKSQQVELRIDGAARQLELYWLLIGNTRSYGGVLNITGKARADDGLLDAYAFCGHGLGWVLRTGVRVATRRQDGSDGVTYYRAREIDVLTPGLPVQADGEYFGTTPMRFSVVPSALTMRVPRDGVRELVGRSQGTTT
jgi:diacylglycerol kinase (ATP)